MAEKKQTRSIGRDAGTGKFMTVDAAKSRPNTAIVQRIPIPKKGK